MRREWDGVVEEVEECQEARLDGVWNEYGGELGAEVGGTRFMAPGSLAASCGDVHRVMRGAPPGGPLRLLTGAHRVWSSFLGTARVHARRGGDSRDSIEHRGSPQASRRRATATGRQRVHMSGPKVSISTRCGVRHPRSVREPELGKVQGAVGSSAPRGPRVCHLSCRAHG